MQLNDTKEDRATATASENYEGGKSYDPATPELRLYRRVINNMLEETFYESDQEQFDNLIDAMDGVADSDPEFILQLAAYARDKVGLRDVPQVMLAWAGNDERTKEFVPQYGSSIVQRPDDMATGLAVNNRYGSSVPSVLQTVYEEAFNRWDEYQFAKYRMESREISLVDCMNLVHPEPYDDEHDELFERLVRGDMDDYEDVEPLRQHGTWEDERSSDDEEDDRSEEQQWRDSLDRMGVLAKIRNIRNMKQAGLESEEIVSEGDIEDLGHSKVWPWRVYQAYKAVKNAGVSDAYLDTWFSDAIDRTVNTVDLDGRTLVAADVSGSMRRCSVSNQSMMDCDELATFFAAVMAGNDGVTVGAFADDWRTVNPHANDPALTVMNRLSNLNVGGSTNGFKAIDWAKRNDEAFDRMVFLTDEQMWDSRAGFGTSRSLKESLDEYRSALNGNTSLYVINLNSYGDLVTPEGYEQVYRISGWHDEILDFCKEAEKTDEALRQVREFKVE